MDYKSAVPSSYAKKIFPSKKILTLVGILAAAGILYWGLPHAITYYKNHRALTVAIGKPPEPLITTAPSPNAFDQDSDRDGISDWQENLFGLNPDKKDTDGDGTDDALPTVNGESLGNYVSVTDTGKLTLAVYGAFENTPTDSIEPEQVQQVISEEILTSAQSIESGLKKYTTVDLNLGDSDKASIIAYQKSINASFDTIADPAIFAKNIQEKILKGTGNVSNELATINSMIKKMIVMPVPAKISDLHLSLINAAYYVVQVLEMPQSDDEITTYTRSIIAQKNINLVQQTVFDINVVGVAYRTSPN